VSAVADDRAEEGAPTSPPDPRRVVATEGAPAAIGPYSQAVRVGGLAFTSGQIGLDPASGHLVVGGVGAETERALANVRAILSAAGGGLDRVVKTTVYLADLADFGEMNAAYARVFAEVGGPPPARATVGGCALPLGARVEIEAVAVVGQ
jgi:2-iminobutanoate/2-iminopropanoate deaminase